MGFLDKAEYELAARDFFYNNQNIAEIYRGTWNSSRGNQSGQVQLIIRHNGMQLIINQETGQIIDFYEGISLDGFINIEDAVVMLTSGTIQPAIGIGEFLLGTNKIEIFKIIKDNFNVWKREDGFSVYSFDNYKLWFGVNDELEQIGVTKGFLGDYKNISVGMTMTDVNRMFGNYHCDGDVYEIPGIKGICFELEDVDDWDEMTAPIEWIFVYRC